MDLGSNGPTWNGRVVSLHVCNEAAEPMTEVPGLRAQIVKGGRISVDDLAAPFSASVRSFGEAR